MTFSNPHDCSLTEGKNSTQGKPMVAMYSNSMFLAQISTVASLIGAACMSNAQDQ